MESMALRTSERLQDGWLLYSQDLVGVLDTVRPVLVALAIALGFGATITPPLGQNGIDAGLNDSVHDALGHLLRVRHYDRAEAAVPRQSLQSILPHDPAHM